MSYAIICNARKGEVLGISTLALVDRKLTKKYWWTSDSASVILNYVSRAAAEYCVSRLKKNNARIVDYDYAKKLIKRQSDLVTEAIREFDHIAAMDDTEQGWDAHKSAF